MHGFVLDGFDCFLGNHALDGHGWDIGVVGGSCVFPAVFFRCLVDGLCGLFEYVAVEDCGGEVSARDENDECGVLLVLKSRLDGLKNPRRSLCVCVRAFLVLCVGFERAPP